ncbi:hypothetical protein ACIBSW_39620 [Actinoplanes sp. NPDC049668]
MTTPAPEPHIIEISEEVFDLFARPRCDAGRPSPDTVDWAAS